MLTSSKGICPFRPFAGLNKCDLLSYLHEPRRTRSAIYFRGRGGERLDKILARRYGEIHSRTYFQYLIEEHLVLLNGAPVKKRIKPKAGDEIEIEFAALPEIDLKPENIPLDILYEDEFLIAVNKPAGMVTHPAPGNWSGTFVNALLYHCQDLANPSDTIRPGIVHRLDKDTSGVLIAAKTLEIQQKLIELFATRQVYKEYLTICLGHAADGEIEAPIGRHPVLRKQMAVVPEGRMAISVCKNLRWDGKLSLMQVVILTGRTHQIRVHLKYKGTPVLGDSVYGSISANNLYKANRQLLHASVLRLRHPATGELMEFKAEIPADMKKMFSQFL